MGKCSRAKQYLAKYSEVPPEHPDSETEIFETLAECEDILENLKKFTKKQADNIQRIGRSQRRAAAKERHVRSSVFECDKDAYDSDKQNAEAKELWQSDHSHHNKHPHAKAKSYCREDDFDLSDRRA
jgi:hypothetical protein